MIYRLELSYRGESFSGWQRQTNAGSVQQTVEEALERLLERRVPIHGAGRTDAGVHALGQVAHFELERQFPLRGLVLGCNRHLPEVVRVLGAARMPAGFHARKSAKAKEYRYQLSRTPVLSPLYSWRVHRLDPRVDRDAVEQALEQIVGRHDFSAFALSGGSHRDPRRTIFEATLVASSLADGSELLELRFVGDGFLRGMVRSLVGTLIEVGRGRMSHERFGALLAGGARSAAGPTAPAHGLVLHRVLYDERSRPEEQAQLVAPEAL